MKLLSWVAGVVALASAGCSGSAPGTAETTARELTVGVIPYAVTGVESCPPSPKREPVHFSMDDDDGTQCSRATGDWGEGTWVLPDAVRPSVPIPCKTTRDHTVLQLCRVSVAEDAFRPLTTDPSRTEDFYAVMRFGPRCPPGSVEIYKKIYNEEQDVAKEEKEVPEEASGLWRLRDPNESVNDELFHYTRLFFCYFRAAATEAETMQRFPDIGIPYAVFHDFDDYQPGWVIAKRWLLSDDDNNASTYFNTYGSPTEDRSVIAEFSQKVIKNPMRDAVTDTYFDMARVR
jgi:hypothetical protein